VHARCTGGRRLLRSWICRPLRDVSAIGDRLDALEELAEAVDGRAGAFRSALRTAPDLERAVGAVRSAVAAPAAGLPLELKEAAQGRRVLIDGHTDGRTGRQT
jgi:DNA mismatch repair ATPase MutS